ncbi:MAG TPA: YjbQ family protein [Crocinitomix sp.]|nr:YjbQ family protein [Crocinitomix sp.]
MTQKVIVLTEYRRGFHIITSEIIKALPMLPKFGLLHLFIKHTSAGICINENADPTVLNDMNLWFDKNIKENEPYYRHTYEGADDMPAHIKSVLVGTELSIPITNHQLSLGTWQGIYLAEFRNYGGKRTIVATVMG